ncbi:MAG: formimidoylglutamase [Bacteroidales bacterium]|nr:formimidoylglutamase [Bacteroidales bacterium]
MNLNDYFDPVELEKPEEYIPVTDSIFGRSIRVNTPSNPIDEISDYQIALIGIPEDRDSHNKGTALAPDRIRGKLYQLFRVDNKSRIIDLGNLKHGNTFNDTFMALRDVLSELINNQVVSVILGGSQDLTRACFSAFEQLRNAVNLVTIDSTIDAINTDSGSSNFLIKTLTSNRLFEYTNLGHQQYLTDMNCLKLLENRNFESIRLGNIREKIFLAEPILRDADLVSFDIGALRQGDAPARKNTSPNGLFADEACQIARYSGMGNRILCFGIFEVNPKFDINEITSHIAAQMIWYFIEGFSIRKSEYPSPGSNEFKVFIISHDDMEHDITFLKSIKTGRWWMEVPVVKAGRKIMVACSQEDYQQACNHDIPDLWWKSFRKLN